MPKFHQRVQRKECNTWLNALHHGENQFSLTPLNHMNNLGFHFALWLRAIERLHMILSPCPHVPSSLFSASADHFNSLNTRPLSSTVPIFCTVA